VLFENSTTHDIGFSQINNNAVSAFHDLGTPGAGYSEVGVGDFNGDGTADVLFQNSGTGDTGFWQVNNNAVSAFRDLGTPGAGFHILAS
jgi:hypothetical protein